LTTLLASRYPDDRIGRLPLDKICTHQLPVAEVQRGLDLVERQGLDQGLADSGLSFGRT
jgi:hypothetical protein